MKKSEIYRKAQCAVIDSPLSAEEKLVIVRLLISDELSAVMAEEGFDGKDS